MPNRKHLLEGYIVKALFFDNPEWIYGVVAYDAHTQRFYIHETLGRPEANKLGYLKDADQVILIRNCVSCKFNKSITYAPQPSGSQDGVYCGNREHAIQCLRNGIDNAVDEYNEVGYVHLWRLEAVNGLDAECPYWEHAIEGDTRKSASRIDLMLESLRSGGLTGDDT